MASLKSAVVAAILFAAGTAAAPAAKGPCEMSVRLCLVVAAKDYNAKQIDAVTSFYRKVLEGISPVSGPHKLNAAGKAAVLVADDTGYHPVDMQVPGKPKTYASDSIDYVVRAIEAGMVGMGTGEPLHEDDLMSYCSTADVAVTRASKKTVALGWIVPFSQDGLEGNVDLKNAAFDIAYFAQDKQGDALYGSLEDAADAVINQIADANGDGVWDCQK